MAIPQQFANFEPLERRLCLSAALAGTATGSVVYQYALPGGASTQVPLADWIVYDDVGNTGSYAAGDPVAATNLQGDYTLSLASASETARVLPRSGWTTAPGAAAALTATPGANLSAFSQTMVAPTVIDVVAAYTASAAQTAGPGADDVITTLASMFAYANQVQANSDTNIEINVVDTLETNFSESGSLEADLQTLSSGGIADVAAAKKAQGADLSLLFEGDETGPSSGETGLAYEFTRAHPNASEGDAIVSLLGNLSRDSVTLAHELGHLLGADHDPAHVEDSLSAPFARGYEFVGDDGVAYQDVMSYGDGTFLPYYSTPAAFYAGHVLGIVSHGDNARAVRQDGPAVARYAISGDEGPATAPAESDLMQSVSLGKSGAVLLGSKPQRALVTLTNVGPAAASETASITLSLAGVATTAEPTLASATVSIRLQPGQSRTVTMPITWPVGLASGSYAVNAITTAAGWFAMASDGSGPAASTAITYQQPTIDLSASPVKSTIRGSAGHLTSVLLRIHNAGNTLAVGTVAFSASVAPASGAGDALSLSLPTRRVSVPAAATRPLGLSFQVPSQLVAGTYVVTLNFDSTTSPADQDQLDKTAMVTLTVV